MYLAKLIKNALPILFVAYANIATSQTYLQIDAVINQNKTGQFLSVETIEEKKPIEASPLIGIQFGGQSFFSDEKWIWNYELGISQTKYSFWDTYNGMDPFYGFVKETTEVKDHFYFINLGTGLAYNIKLGRKLQIHCAIIGGMLYNIASNRKLQVESIGPNEVISLSDDFFPYAGIAPSMSLNPGKRDNPWRINFTPEVKYFITAGTGSYNIGGGVGIGYLINK